MGLVCQMAFMSVFGTISCVHHAKGRSVALHGAESRECRLKALP